MEQLTVKDLREKIKGLRGDTPIYLGNDDELNGIHMGWYIDILDKTAKDEDTQNLIETIQEDGHNEDFKKKAVLIS